MLSEHDWPQLQPADGASSLAGGEADDGLDLGGCFARCFATADGQRVLAHLRRVAFGRVFGPEASEAALRHAEGQKQLVALILAFTRRGASDRA